MTVLVLNSGSSSVKYAVVDPDSGAMVADGIVERIGEGPRTRGGKTTEVADHAAALQVVFGELADPDMDRAGRGRPPGGARRARPVRADGGRRRTDRQARASCLRLRRCTIRPHVLGIEVARKALPDLPHVAVFDTAFFHDLPPAAATYAIDRDIAAQWHIRRYGFHGTSHQYVSEQAAAFLGAAAGALQPDRAASRQRRLGVGDRRRATGGHVDGPDADGGPGDGHPVRRHRPRHHHLPVRAPPG